MRSEPRRSRRPTTWGTGTTRPRTSPCASTSARARVCSTGMKPTITTICTGSARRSEGCTPRGVLRHSAWPAAANIAVGGDDQEYTHDDAGNLTIQELGPASQRVFTWERGTGWWGWVPDVERVILGDGAAACGVHVLRAEPAGDGPRGHGPDSSNRATTTPDGADWASGEYPGVRPLRPAHAARVGR
jgi:hypothetical protein